jgi:hypothetical protein
MTAMGTNMAHDDLVVYIEPSYDDFQCLTAVPLLFFVADHVVIYGLMGPCFAALGDDAAAVTDMYEHLVKWGTVSVVSREELFDPSRREKWIRQRDDRPYWNARVRPEKLWTPFDNSLCEEQGRVQVAGESWPPEVTAPPKRARLALLADDFSRTVRTLEVEDTQGFTQGCLGNLLERACVIFSDYARKGIALPGGTKPAQGSAVQRRIFDILTDDIAISGTGADTQCLGRAMGELALETRTRVAEAREPTPSEGREGGTEAHGPLSEFLKDMSYWLYARARSIAQLPARVTDAGQAGRILESAADSEDVKRLKASLKRFRRRFQGRVIDEAALHAAMREVGVLLSKERDVSLAYWLLASGAGSADASVVASTAGGTWLGWSTRAFAGTLAFAGIREMLRVTEEDKGKARVRLLNILLGRN